MAVGPDEVRRIAELARLRLGESEVEALAGELSGILGHIDALEEVEGTGAAEGGPVAGGSGEEGGARREEGGSSPVRVPGASAGSAAESESGGDSDVARASTGSLGASSSSLRGDEPGGDPLALPPAEFAPDFVEGLFLVPRLASHGRRGSGSGSGRHRHPHTHRGGPE